MLSTCFKVSHAFIDFINQQDVACVQNGREYCATKPAGRSFKCLSGTKVETKLLDNVISPPEGYEKRSTCGYFVARSRYSGRNILMSLQEVPQPAPEVLQQGQLMNN